MPANAFQIDRRAGADWIDELRELFRRGRISLAIALAFLTASIAVGDLVAGSLGDGRLGGILREGS